ncbi:tRNA (cytosine(34)-C(5))-methyltransferase [Actinomortierella wolfii]|nr:tRNA (cytosine(34)-C(5))-methyltransferase [Actinomortierella wolfii]
MGRRFNKKRYEQRQKKERTENTSYEEVVRENEKMEAYYKAQKLVSDEEWPTFWSYLKQTLPTTFRITGSRSHAEEIRDTVKEAFVPHLTGLEVDGVKVEPPRPLPWYPNQLGWHFAVPRGNLRRNEEYSKFHKFLVAETEVGNISRQEAVSMIPPLLLDVKPKHWVMDMCAAPGSKTAQLIEMVHAEDQPGEVPEGLILANDADSRRSYMLIHQTKRLQSPCLMVTNHDASLMPWLRIAKEKGEEVGIEATEEEDDGKPTRSLQFDRVLADVPCSGDGTVRKNPTIWNNWTFGGAMGLHQTQVNILQRGVQMLKVGGRIVYSTCSLNPMENEAVVAELLNRSNGTLELVDVSNELPELIRKPGLSHWTVFTKEGVQVDRLEDLPKDAKGKFFESMWPPKNAKDLHLERCLRIYPHLQDTGGFFVAVLKKTGLYNAPKEAPRPIFASETSEEVEADAEKKDKEEGDAETGVAAGDKHKLEASTPGGDSETAEVAPKKAKLTKAERFNQASLKEEPYVFLPEDNSDIVELSKFYGLDTDRFPMDRFLVRNEGEKNKTIYFVSKAVKAILQSDEVSKLKVVNTGVRVFIRQDSNAPAACPFRAHAEGLAMTYPFFSDARVIPVQLDSVEVLLRSSYPKTTEFPEYMQEKLAALPTGCCIFEFDPAKEPNKDQANKRWEGQGVTGFVKTKTVFPVWKAQVSFNMLLNKQERRSFAMRLGVDYVDTPHMLESRMKTSGEEATSESSAIATPAESTPAATESEDIELPAAEQDA